MDNETFENIITWAKKHLPEEVSVAKEAHGDRSDVFRLIAPHHTYFLKIAPDLTDEYQRLKWLKGTLPVPKVIVFENIFGYDALLLSGIPGKNLKILSKEWAAEKVVIKLAEALRLFHTTSITDCPFRGIGNGDTLIHGDACLPNFIFDGDTFSGYIDLGDMTVGEKETDFAAAIWSLQYNLGKGFGKMFLEQYGVTDATEALVEKLRLRYEDMQEKWGL